MNSLVRKTLFAEAKELVAASYQLQADAILPTPTTPAAHSALKAMSENPINPVATALANALKNAIGICFTSLPFRAHRTFSKLAENKL